jgi:hypothetical protein
MTVASQTLAELRWDVDQLITNHEGERVWLGAAFDAEGKRIGITDCCRAEDPCEHHLEVSRRGSR